MTKLDKQSNTNERIFLEMTRRKRNLMGITLFFRKYITKRIGSTTKMQSIEYDYLERRIKDCNSGKPNHERHRSKRLHSPSHFSERRSITIREAYNINAGTQGYIKEQLAYAVAAACSQRRRS